MAKTKESVDDTGNSHKLAKRWHHAELLNDGWLGVPSAFLQQYAQLKPYPLTTGEALFVLHLMDFKWDEKHPFPGYKRLGLRMGVSDKMARRHAQSLETKGYLKREMRVGQTNRFDLIPLFDALKSALDAAKKKAARNPARTPSRRSGWVERKIYSGRVTKRDK